LLHLWARPTNYDFYLHDREALVPNFSLYPQYVAPFLPSEEVF
jgi:hypothetical protein